MIKFEQRGATRNQSTVDYSLENIFLFGNRYQTAVLLNSLGDAATLNDGVLVVRNVTSGNIEPATSLNLADVVGVLKAENLVLAVNGTANVNFCTSGDIDSSLLLLPATITLNTTVGNKKLKDVLTGLGFNIKNVTENSKFDN